MAPEAPLDPLLTGVNFYTEQIDFSKLMKCLYYFLMTWYNKNASSFSWSCLISDECKGIQYVTASQNCTLILKNEGTFFKKSQGVDIYSKQ